MNNNIKPVVSICMITYNHEKYIAQAIESILMQKTNFGIELVIGNDASTDSTHKICLKYKNQYPDIIKLFSPEKNIGMMPNLINTFANSTGKYIAMCEGDDYWSDIYKLQKQVDYLEQNPSFVGCYHNTEERYEGDYSKASYLYSTLKSSKQITFNDLTEMNYIPTCSSVFKNLNVDELPNWYLNQKLGDWTLHLINSLKGNYGYIPQVMAVHRIHGESTWALQDQKRNEAYVTKTYEDMIESKFFNTQQTNILKKMKSKFVKKHILKKKVKELIGYIIKI